MGHHRQVADLCGVIAEALGIDDKKTPIISIDLRISCRDGLSAKLEVVADPKKMIDGKLETLIHEIVADGQTKRRSWAGG